MKIFEKISFFHKKFEMVGSIERKNDKKFDILCFINIIYMFIKL